MRPTHQYRLHWATNMILVVLTRRCRGYDPNLPRLVALVSSSFDVSVINTSGAQTHLLKKIPSFALELSQSCPLC